MPTWPNPPLTTQEQHDFTAIMDADPETAAMLLDSNRSQAAAAQRYVMLVCVVRQRMRRGIPCEREQRSARALLRCIAPGVRNRFPEAIRFGV